jgi:hypothetical protein
MSTGGAMKKLAVMLLLGLILLSGNALADAAFTLPSGVHVSIVEAKFKKNDFHLSGCEDIDKPCLINGHVPFGPTDNLPKTYVKAITVSYLGHLYSLDVSDMYDAWGSCPLAVRGAVRYFGGSCSTVEICQFRGLFSDGASSYVAEWKIADGIPIRTVLSNSSDIVNLFMQNIDPPEE